MNHVFLLCAVALLSGADPKAEPKAAPPGVNWQGQVVHATGAGAPDMKAANPAEARLGAERAALADALRNLLAQVKGVSVDGTKKVDELMKQDEVRLKVEGVVRGYKITGKRYFSDNGVEIEVEVPLAMFTDVVDPDPTPVVLPSKGKAEEKPSNTGLVIDARGLKVIPALAPRVLDDGGRPLYSIDSLSKDARKVSGVAAYVQSLDDAHKSMKAGDRPLVLKAQKANGADVQLNPEDAKKLASMNTSFLADGKVVIVLN